MARIRSIHPGFFTDENLVSVSIPARLLFLGLGVEADDKGVFEWKPLTIKMRIFPVDNVDVPALLAELAGANAIRFYEIDGRKLGAIRNFRRFQKPKTPNDIHPSTPEIRNYVGLPDAISETFPPKGEKSPQMEEGGGKRDSVSNETAPTDPEKILFDHGIAILANGGVVEAKARPLLGKWKKHHGAEATIIALGRAKREGAIDPVSFVEGCLRHRTREAADGPLV